MDKTSLHKKLINWCFIPNSYLIYIPNKHKNKIIPRLLYHSIFGIIFQGILLKEPYISLARISFVFLPPNTNSIIKATENDMQWNDRKTEGTKREGIRSTRANTQTELHYFHKNHLQRSQKPLAAVTKTTCSGHKNHLQRSHKPLAVVIRLPI